jgi:hypothetical protein
MKNFSKLLLVLLITISYTNIQSQDNNNPWQFSFGINAVDLDADTNTSFNEFFDVDENWNVSSGMSMFTLSKYLGDDLSLGLSGSVNSISKFADGREFLNDATYFAGDLMLKYSLGEVLDMQKNGAVYRSWFREHLDGFIIVDDFKRKPWNELLVF